MSALASVVETFSAASLLNPTKTSTLSAAVAAANPTVASSEAALSAVRVTVSFVPLVTIADVMLTAANVTLLFEVSPSVSQISLVQSTTDLTSVPWPPILSKLVPPNTNCLATVSYSISSNVVVGAIVSITNALASEATAPI